jgi:hypothetical protein
VVGILVDELFTNTHADGSGTMLWGLKVSYKLQNASTLLQNEGKYLVLKFSTSEDTHESAKWFAFTHSSFFDEEETHNFTGFFNKYVYAVQFAVVDVAPDDSLYGSYDAIKLQEENFVALSDVYYNVHYAA